MDDLRINLSEREYAFLDEEASAAGHASVEDYAASVIRAELKAKAQGKLEALLAADLQGEATEWTKADSERLLRLAATGR